MVGTSISHYRIIEKLGEGGMGIVYRAEDTKLGRPVALKFLTTPISTNERERKRFHLEAQAAASLVHPNIATIFELNETDGGSVHPGQMYIAMEYVTGENLSHLLCKGPLPLEQVHSVAVQVARGLLAAHKAGVVHCDIKPSNISIASDGTAKILDFGLAHLAGRSGQTDSNIMRGTPAYMAPEQISGGHVDQRTDVWAFGVLLHEMLTGDRPFRGDHAPAVMYSVLNEEPINPATLRRDMPENLRILCKRCLEKDPEKRIQTMEDVLRLLGEEPPLQGGVSGARRRQEWLAIAGGLAVLLAAGWFIVSRWLTPAAQEERVWRVAILPFQSSVSGATSSPAGSGEPGVGNLEGAGGWSRLVQALLVRELTGVENLAVLDPVSLNDFLMRTAGGFEANRASGLYATLQKAEVGFIIDGNIVKSGDRYHLSVNIIDPRSYEVRYSQQKEFVNEAGLSTVVGEVAEDVLDFFRVQVLQVGKDKDLRPWTQQRRQNIAAVRAFMQASELIYRGERGAEKYLRQAVELDSAFISARVWLVSVLANRNERAEARRQYEELIPLEAKASPFEQAMIGWASSFLSNDVRGQARFLKLSLEFSPGNHILAFNLARVLYELKEYRRAADILHPAIESKWEYSPAYYQYALCLYEQGFKQEAREILEESLTINPVFPTSYAMLFALSLRASDTTEAAEYERLAIQQSGSFGRDLARIYGTMGYFCLAEGLYPKAVHYFGKALTLSPDNAARRRYRGEAYFGMGEFDSARRDFEHALEKDSSLYDAHRWLGQIFEIKQDTTRAIDHYQMFLRKDSLSETAKDIQGRLFRISKP
ncbi:MAG TPA: serine/threonine-protein kinase [Bacteroidota bacterium]|nr:serine/threonine-protein kinase [Bacteroidota bacterium]